MQRRPANMYKRDSVCLDAQIQLAEHILVILNAEMGDELAAALLESWATKKKALSPGERASMDRLKWSAIQTMMPQPAQSREFHMVFGNASYAMSCNRHIQIARRFSLLERCKCMRSKSI